MIKPKGGDASKVSPPFIFCRGLSVGAMLSPWHRRRRGPLQAMYFFFTKGAERRRVQHDCTDVLTMQGLDLVAPCRQQWRKGSKSFRRRDTRSHYTEGRNPTATLSSTHPPPKVAGQTIRYPRFRPLSVPDILQAPDRHPVRCRRSAPGAVPPPCYRRRPACV